MINIRTIQHYMYCPRRFGLLEIENAWAENVSGCVGEYYARKRTFRQNTNSKKAITRLFKLGYFV